MFKSTFLLVFALNVFQSNGDLVNVYNGLITTWSYNSSDSILHPLMIQFIPVSHMEEAPSYVQGGSQYHPGFMDDKYPISGGR
ncbi:uncharacterized protein N7469_004631 [Penicillium citrinum]|uniref:Uncharacterized protein n=1 Tax=Penicillium citrinum TaxID=5077 RepID=A0A9W9TRD5_PENCI|nr:uncharacterized protein N7469_004631 [Penicillium citrinum]KAJ5235463.1 hypothetical protein N7469_004631 [Penicillium citrinum]